jgi:hypothetical protein
MIISRVIGGLGNQMFQYAIAKAISLENKDDFKLNISDFKTDQLFPYRLNQFKITEKLATKKEIQSFLGRKQLLYPIKKRLGMTPLYREKERCVFDRAVFDHANIYLKGYWQNALYFNKYRKSILDDFTPVKDFSKETKDYLEQIKNCQSTSVHIRRGDYLKHAELGVLTLDYYHKAMKHISELCPDSRFYVFSNDITWCKEAFKDLSNINIVENPESEISDMWLMSHCKNNIIANSSFSWWGAWLNKHDNKIVISPKEWRKDNPEHHKWVPNGWLQF